MQDFTCLVSVSGSSEVPSGLYPSQALRPKMKEFKDEERKGWGGEGTNRYEICPQPPGSIFILILQIRQVQQKAVHTAAQMCASTNRNRKKKGRF